MSRFVSVVCCKLLFFLLHHPRPPLKCLSSFVAPLSFSLILFSLSVPLVRHSLLSRSQPISFFSNCFCNHDFYCHSFSSHVLHSLIPFFSCTFSCSLDLFPFILSFASVSFNQPCLASGGNKGHRESNMLHNTTV